MCYHPFVFHSKALIKNGMNKYHFYLFTTDHFH